VFADKPLFDSVAPPLGIISHSPSEIVIDFARLLPGVPKSKVLSRIVMTPLNLSLWGGLNPETAKILKVVALDPLDMRISELVLSPRRAWRIQLDNVMTLALGRDHTDARLARFVALYPRLFVAQPADQSVLPPAPLSIDLRYPDGFAFRMPGGVAPVGFASPAPAGVTSLKPSET
jgi:hypothetical protein